MPVPSAVRVARHFVRTVSSQDQCGRARTHYIGNAFTHSTSLVDGETVVRSLMLDGNFEQIIGSDASTFLQQCTTRLAESGSGVECVDLRPDPARSIIIVDVRGPRGYVNEVVAGVGSDGLYLPSFPPLFVAGLAERDCTFHFLSWVSLYFVFRSVNK